jgi:predicted Zn finger-like uncharacterized protein
MIIVCPSCQSRYRFDESKLGERPKARTRCAKCGGTIEIENPAFGAMTLPPSESESLPAPPPAPPTPTTTVTAPAPAARPHAPTQAPAPQHAPDERLRTQRSLAPADEATGGQTITGQDLHRMGILELPRDKRYSLAVIQGPATGQIFQISKSRTTLGRSGCDVDLNDPECSRQHAVVEIFGERILLRDLDSTNGTFIDLERVQSSELANHTEFRIGSHVLMLIVTEVE